VRAVSHYGQPAPKLITTFFRDDQGLSITEYAIAAGLIAATVVGAYFLLGTTVNGLIIALTAAL
jgi:Flp pilus assembly pilin Flp